VRSRLDAVHAVFALPEVERTTDLLPEIIGIVGAFLSANAKPAEYVSIHALLKQATPGRFARERGQLQLGLNSSARWLEGGRAIAAGGSSRE